MPVINQGLLGSKYMNMMPTLGAGAWSPANLSPAQLLQWLDATDQETVILNGTRVAQLNDKSGNDKHASQATVAYQPIYVSSGTLNYMNHEGTTDYLISPSVTDENGVTSFFVFATVHFSQDLLQSSNRYAFRMWGNNTPFASPSNPNQVYRNGNLVNVTNSVEGLDEFRRGVDNIQIGEMRGMNFDDSVWRNNNWNYGGSGGGFQFEDRLYEIIHLAPEATLEDILRTEGYLAWKYGLQGDLPPSHPYKLAAPTTEVMGYSPFFAGANIILDLQNEATVSLNGGNISGVENSANSYVGDFVQTNASQQPSYNLSDLNANNFKTIDTNNGITAKIGLESEDDLVYSDVFFVCNYKDGLDTTFDNYSTLIKHNVDTAKRVLGTNGSDLWYSINTLSATASINGKNPERSALPMPFSIVRISGAKTDPAGVVTLMFNEATSTRDWEGSLAHFSFFEDQLSQYDADKVVGSLAHDFNLVDSLSLGHPYRAKYPTTDIKFEPFTEAVTWFTAGDNASVTLNGGDVASIQDYSRYDLNFAQVTAVNQPAYDSTNGQIDFDGANEFLTVGDTSTYQFLHEEGGTIAVRFKLNSSDSGALQVLFATAHLTSSDTGVSLAIDDRNTSDNRLYFNVGKSVGGTLCYKTFNLSAFDIGNVSDQFQTIVVTYDDVSADFYVDGVLLTSQNILSALGTGSQSRIARVGTEASGAFDLDGSISRLYIGDRKLSQAEVTSLTNKLNS